MTEIPLSMINIFNVNLLQKTTGRSCRGCAIPCLPFSFTPFCFLPLLLLFPLPFLPFCLLPFTLLPGCFFLPVIKTATELTQQQMHHRRSYLLASSSACIEPPPPKTLSEVKVFICLHRIEEMESLSKCFATQATRLFYQVAC